MRISKFPVYQAIHTLGYSSSPGVLNPEYPHPLWEPSDGGTGQDSTSKQ